MAGELTKNPALVQKGETRSVRAYSETLCSLSQTSFHRWEVLVPSWDEARLTRVDNPDHAKDLNYCIQYHSA